jgi:hypothetical protein
LRLNSLLFSSISSKLNTASMHDLPPHNLNWSSTKNFSECSFSYPFNIFAYVL